MAAPILATSNLLAPTALGVGLSGFFSGANFALTYMAVPGLLLPAATSQSQAKGSSTSGGKLRPATSDPQLARQWRLVYLSGKGILPWVSLISSICFAYVAWNLPSTSSSFAETEKSLRSLKWGFVVAASLAISIVPWTLIIMRNTNATLEERAGQADAIAERSEPDVLEADVKGNENGSKGITTEELMRWWGALNLIRSSLSFSAILTVVGGLFLYG